ncbi:SPOR domain-containing protein [Hydrogenophaga sp. 5NK40-0174]|uniref:SPOR domain-containing protein n=1 Tax=Hydrogenophaga sp. 5NK40-0174 TaxID=3127649 RepID=UPI00333E53C3
MLKSRSGSKAGASSQAAQSIDDVRRRARHRLIGATILVLIGVVGFSLLFDSQPRPVAGLVPIEIPDRGEPAAAAVASSPVDGQSTGDDVGRDAGNGGDAAPITDQRATLDDGEEAVEDGPPAAAAPEPRAEPVKAPEPAPAPVPPAPAPIKPKTPVQPPATPKPAPAPEPKPEEASSPNSERYVVQVGAFADASSVTRVRRKLESAGMKTYTQAVNTAAGKRTRVRLGPFDSRASAEKAAAKAKALGLPGRVLTL